MVLPLFLPSPDHGVWYLGSIPIRGYALSILAGIIIGFLILYRRWKKLNESVEQLENIVLVAVVMGIIGARVYWIIIEWHRYFGAGHTEPWFHIFYIWRGGLGIWGAIAFGFLTAWLGCRHYKLSFLRMADCAAPGFLTAQGIGRLGNWWNQELYGKPTTLPWGLEIDASHRVDGYQQYETFHPTFLYEMLWDFAGVGLLLFLEKKFKLGRGKLFACYIIIYATGRFLVELLRIDPVDTFFGLRVNSWATLMGGVVGIVLLLWLLKNRPGHNEPKTTVSDSADTAVTDGDTPTVATESDEQESEGDEADSPDESSDKEPAT